MARTRRSFGFTALRVEGGILPPEYIQSIAALEAPSQAGADYGLSKSLDIKDEIARYWRISSDLYDRYKEPDHRGVLRPSLVGVEKWLVPLMRSVFRYEDLATSEVAELSHRTFRLTHKAWGGAVPLLLVTSDFDLDKADPRFGHDGRRQSPHSMMQEYLNTEDAALWGIVSNGSKLRILRDNSSLTKPAYIEVDFELVFAEELYPDFAALWLTAHASRLQPRDQNPLSCIIEVWRTKAHEVGERIRENLRHGVTEALRQLGNGFLQNSANRELLAALKDGELTAEGYFQQLLRLIYRLLFLFTAEERDLLHIPEATEAQRAVYSEGYALSRLRERAQRRRHYDQYQDLWVGLQITFRALARGVSAIGLPALGGLFRADQCPVLDAAAISNDRLLEAVRSLSFFRSNKTLSRVNYRDMDTEELGSVYESLLELRPAIDVYASPWAFSLVGNGNRKRLKGSARKLSGSYYTPPTLVGELIKSTLEPTITQAIDSRPQDPRSAILGLRVVDPACGSGHFLLAVARRLAAEIARIESGSDSMDESTRQHALREVVRNCIYGVDRNPLAVELCKTALWMETVEPGKPLTFLDSHIVQGDSLVGILNPEIMADGIPGSAYKPLTGDDKTVCRELKKLNKAPHQLGLFDRDAILEVAVANMDLDSMPEDTLHDIERKRMAWEVAQGDATRASEAFRANLFVGAYLAPKTPDSLEQVPQTQDLYRVNRGMPQRRGVEDLIQRLARTHRFFHWHLAFAEVMEDGGFDAILGNPPWERIKLQEKEFFASRSTVIAEARNKAARNKLILQLNSTEALPAEKALYTEFLSAKREAEAVSHFVRTAGRFPQTGTGDLNTYAVFAETILQLLSPQGRAGLIVPTGIATDDTTKAFFQHVVNRQRLVSLYDFENRKKVFPGIDSRIKFCLLTLSGGDVPVPEPEFAFFLQNVAHLKDTARRFKLSAEDFTLFNPNTRTCPIFRTRRDMEVARKMYQRAGVFWKEARPDQKERNLWGVSFQRMFDMSNDSDLFRTRAEMEEDGWNLDGNVFVRGEERYWPLYEAKLFHQYDHRFATFDGVSDRDLRGGKARKMTAAEKADVNSFVVPRYWIPEEELVKRLDNAGIGPLNFELGADRSRPEPTGADRSRPEPTGADRSRPEPTGADRSRPTITSRFGLRRERPTTEVRSARSCRMLDSVTRLRDSDSELASSSEADYECYQSKNTSILRHNASRAWSQSRCFPNWFVSIRKTTRSTDERTCITSVVEKAGMSDRAPLICLSEAEAAASLLGNLNSIVLDFAARTSVGGTDLSYFIIKQLPVLPPQAFLDEFVDGITFADLVYPRVMELTFTANAARGFANDLGYHGPPFSWTEERRHRLRCELDAIFAHMYGLSRCDLEWILDAQPPSESFPGLKRVEIREYGEFRTARYVLEAFDSLENGEEPNLREDWPD